VGRANGQLTLRGSAKWREPPLSRTNGQLTLRASANWREPPLGSTPAPPPTA
jgi:hypothetical protein